MDGYKIGSISSVFGVSNDTIRYYESRGILTPKRDEESGYRYYDSWDINYLLDCLRYRSYDLPVSDIEQMLKSDDVEDVLERLRKHEAALVEQINAQRNILKQVSRLKSSLSDIRSRLGQFSIVQSPEMIWQSQREGIRDEEGRLANGKGAAAVREWVGHMLYLRHTFIMPELSSRNDFGEYSWGFSLSPEKLAELGMKMPETALFLPSYQSIYTVFAAGEAGSFLSSIREQVIEPIKEKGYRITSPPVGNLLVRVHENGQMKRYCEVWVPIGE